LTYRFFRQRPAPTIGHATLGLIVWSAEDRAYGGDFNGLKFSLANAGSLNLPNELVAYAASTLVEPSFLVSSVDEEKQKWIARNPAEAAEIEQLRIGVIGFRWRNSMGGILAMLEPESDKRLWRIEFEGVSCRGLGFDS
jgi:hypothetical protein